MAGLAMIPITLAAAAEIQLAQCDAEIIQLAVQTWPASPAEVEVWTDLLCQWWETYRTLRPAWATALQALDRLLDSTGT